MAANRRLGPRVETVMHARRYASHKETMDGQEILRVWGGVDLQTSAALRADLLSSIEGSQGDIVVDLSNVEFMDSTGLGVLLGALRRLAEDRRSLELVLAAPTVLRVFEVTGLDHVFNIRHGEPVS